tara:strand:- start:2 stop:889 length:888 start_codon:yes stop_codon:yes gene_type:complete
MGRPVYADPTYRPPAPKLYDEEGNYNPRFSDLPTVDPDKDAEMYPPSSQRKDFDQEAADKRREQRMRDLEDPEKKKEMIDRLTNPEVKGDGNWEGGRKLRRALPPFHPDYLPPEGDESSGKKEPEGTPPDRIGGFPNIGGIVPKPGGDPGQSDYMPPSRNTLKDPRDYMPPSRTPEPPREEKEEQPTPSPRRVRTGAVNISNTGTVVGAQGVGNVIGNIRTGNITTGDAPTPRERREQQKKPVKATPPKDTQQGGQQGGGFLGIQAGDGSIITPDTEWRDGMPIRTPWKPLQRFR